MLLFNCISYAQDNKVKAIQLVREGIALHDKSDFEGAIKKYDEAIKLDEELIDAWYEKSFSYSAMSNHKECASLSKKIIKKFPDSDLLGPVYTQLGSSLDDLGKPKEALEAFDAGIKSFPGQFLLHFNKGLTLQKLERYDEALICYQSSLKLKPTHSSSNLFTGMILQPQNKIPALLAFATFMAIEPKTTRSKEALDRIEKIAGAGVKKEVNNITINLDAAMFGKDKEKEQENNFRTTEVLFSLMSANDLKELDSIARGSAEKLSFKLQLLINSLTENAKTGKGFYWTHYVPFFTALKEENLVGVLCHLIYQSKGDEENEKWLTDNEAEVDKFYDFLKAFKWN